MWGIAAWCGKQDTLTCPLVESWRELGGVNMQRGLKMGQNEGKV